MDDKCEWHKMFRNEDVEATKTIGIDYTPVCDECYEHDTPNYLRAINESNSG